MVARFVLDLKNLIMICFNDFIKLKFDNND